MSSNSRNDCILVTPRIIQLFEREGHDSELPNNQAHYLQDGRYYDDRSHKSNAFPVPTVTQKRAIDPRHSEIRRDGRAKADSYLYASTHHSLEGNSSGIDGSSAAQIAIGVVGVVTSVALSAINIAVSKAALRLDVANAYYKVATNAPADTTHAVSQARTGLVETLAAADRVTREVQARANTIALTTNHATPDVAGIVQTDISMGQQAVVEEQPSGCDQNIFGFDRLQSIRAAFRLPRFLAWTSASAQSRTLRAATPLEDTPVSLVNSVHEESIELQEPAVNVPGALADEPSLQAEGLNSIEPMLYIDGLFASIENLENTPSHGDDADGAPNKNNLPAS